MCGQGIYWSGSVADKIQPRKRTLIETANDELKDIAQIEHFSDIVF